MFDKIDNVIKERKLKPSDCSYHTMRELDNNGKIRALVIKGENKAHVEYICPKCGHYEYLMQDWKKVSKSSKFRFETICSKCKNIIKVPKLKSLK